MRLFDVSHAYGWMAFSKYNISPVRIKSLLMTRVLEGYRARRYDYDTKVIFLWINIRIIYIFLSVKYLSQILYGWWCVLTGMFFALCASLHATGSTLPKKAPSPTGKTKPRTIIQTGTNLEPLRCGVWSDIQHAWQLRYGTSTGCGYVAWVYSTSKYVYRGLIPPKQTQTKAFLRFTQALSHSYGTH